MLLAHLDLDLALLRLLILACFWIPEDTDISDCVTGHASFRDPFYSAGRSHVWNRNVIPPSVSVPTDRMAKHCKKRRAETLATCGPHLVDLAVLLGGATHALAQSALYFAHLQRRFFYCFGHATRNTLCMLSHNLGVCFFLLCSSHQGLCGFSGHGYLGKPTTALCLFLSFLVFWVGGCEVFPFIHGLAHFFNTVPPSVMFIMDGKGWGEREEGTCIDKTEWSGLPTYLLVALAVKAC